MAGSVRILIPLALGLAVTALAQEPPENAGPEGQPRKQRPWTKGDPGKRLEDAASPEFDNVRKAIEALTPEQRRRFQENFWRWANLPPEEKRALRDRDELRRKFMREEVEAALKESGLELAGDRKAAFFKRYAEERRRIEEQLRQEMAEKRKPLVREMLAKVKAEFATPAESPAPAKPQP